MVRGAGITFVLTIVSGLFGTILGFIVGWARTAPSKIVYHLLGAYIDIIRSVPLIIQFVLFNSFMAIAGLLEAGYQNPDRSKLSVFDIDYFYSPQMRGLNK